MLLKQPVLCKIWICKVTPALIEILWNAVEYKYKVAKKWKYWSKVKVLYLSICAFYSNTLLEKMYIATLHHCFRRIRRSFHSSKTMIHFFWVDVVATSPSPNILQVPAMPSAALGPFSFLSARVSFLPGASQSFLGRLLGFSYHSVAADTRF